MIESATSILAGALPREHEVDLVVPIARAGFAMLRPTDEATGYVDTMFAIARRSRTGVDCSWTPPDQVLLSRHALLLDVVAATGETLAVVTTELCDRVPTLRSITALLCFATRNALDAMSAAATVPTVAIVGRMCEGVDARGYVIPATNGDSGDKLFGPPIKRSSSTTRLTAPGVPAT